MAKKLYEAGRCTSEFFEQAYYDYVLAKLDPKKVYNDLQGHVILCNKAYNNFCHTHLVSKWLYEKLGVVIIELEDIKK
jgi:uncharacterized protein (DUF488 family)